MGSQIGALFSGLWGDAGQEFVDLQGGPDKVFGTKPDVAPFVPVDLSAETGKAVAGNLANYDSITELLNKIIPGFSDILAQGSENTLAELKGELPPDVAAGIQRSSAFESLMGGYSGTGMAKARSARDLGINSLNLTSMGNNSAQMWSKIAEDAFSPFTVSTGQQSSTTAANNAGKQATDQFQFNVDAAPDPGALGIFNVDAALGQQMLSIGAGMAGGAMGGGGGGGSAQAPPAGYGTPGYAYDPSTGQYVANSGPSTDWRTNATWSDRKLKQDVIFIGRSPKGFNVYEFNYLHHEGAASIRFRGVMAQDVRELCPEAVMEVEGFLRVDYSKLDVKLEVV